MGNSELVKSSQQFDGSMFLYNKPVLLTKEDHGDMGLSSPERLFDFVKDAKGLPIVASEIQSAQKHYPVVFSEFENPLLVSVVGIIDEKNLFVNDNGEWDKNSYVPSYARCHPFAFARRDDEEYAVVERTTVDRDHAVQQVITGEQILEHQKLVRRVPIAPDVMRYALDLARATRPQDERCPEVIRKLMTWGAGPRAVQSLVLGGKTRAVLMGRHHVAIEDIQAIVKPVLRHRLVPNFSAEAEGYTPDRIVETLLSEIDPHHAAGEDERYRKVLSA